MTLETSRGILLGLLTLVQLHFTTSSGTSTSDSVFSILPRTSSSRTSEFSILPNSNTPCPMRPCYNLSQVMDNPSNYFTSNTTVVFPPGHHEVSTEGQLVIQNVNNISLVGDNSDSTKIKCVGEFGLAFINITNLMVSKLSFSMCGASMSNTSQLATSLLNEIFHSFTFPYNPPAPSILSIYLLHITIFTATKLEISHSKGAGLIGVNIFGLSSIQQAVFVNNTPNCAIVFLDSYSHLQTPVLYITNSSFMFGIVSAVEYGMIAGGLNVIATQNIYRVEIYIRNITAYGNIGTVIFGNMLLRINCKVAIQATQINCTEGYYYGLVLEHKGDSTNCSMEDISHFYMSHSYFGRNTIGAKLSFDFTPYSVSVELENITVETSIRAFRVLMNAISVLIMKNLNITHNMGPFVIISEKSSIIEFHGSNTFSENNCTDSVYPALYLMQCNVTFKGTATFLQNKCKYGGALYAEDSEINFQGSLLFLENEAENGGAVYVRRSELILNSEQKLSFVENKGYDGGAMTLDGGSTIGLEANSTVVFVRNHAYHYGGAINYVDHYTENFEPAADLSACFYEIFSIEIFIGDIDELFNYIKMTGINITFYNNSAGFAGAAIFGGWVDFCRFYDNNAVVSANYESVRSLTSVFDSLFHFHQSTQQLSLISSNPTRVCLCTTMSIPDCSITEYTITAYPGETLTIPAVAVGQRFGTVPSSVQSDFVSRDNGRLPELQYTQLVNVNCTNLMYTILSPPNTTEVMKLSVEKYNIPPNIVVTDSRRSLIINQTLTNLQFSELAVHIEVQPCPLGFVFSNNSHTCACHPKLQQHEINCSIDTQIVYRRSPLWINATFLNETYTVVLVHNHCPFDYCKDENIQLNMEHPDEQCALSRSGVLCGSCQQNLSHVLGTSNCKECSSHFLLLIPVFIAAGIVLVVFLMLLNLTVSVGTINGLIFYANIVRANQAIFFPQGTDNKFLSIFIAWLNLDLGIETCFYSGLDAYAKTWLQFLFPLYIWIIVVLIIVSSHYSTTAAKLSGRNAVQVLATLFLLSYAKLLRITITAFSFTLLEYPDGSVKRIWLYDGNVDYLKGKHIALFVAALLLLVFISLPYTVALLFIQCLQYRSRYRILAWVRRLKPLFDAYTGPYNDKHRYWPGLLLVVRVVLFLVFAVNVFGDPAISLLTIIVTTFCINYCTNNFGGIYRKGILNMIEYSFLLNLGILSSATLFTILTDRDQTGVVYTSVAIAFATFMIITIYHILVRMTKQQQRQKFTEWATSKLKALKSTVKIKNNQNNQNNQNNPLQPANHNALIELREPVLEYDN